MFDLMNFNPASLQKRNAQALIKCNDETGVFGLTLTESQAMELCQSQVDSLNDNGRIGFGGGIVEKLILEFCDSPYITQDIYVETIAELTDIFYYFKNETNDKISDEDLLKFMRKAFDGPCKGSVELLAARELEQLNRSRRMKHRKEEEKEDEDIDEDDE